jgi:hypothetical protein
MKRTLLGDLLALSVAGVMASGGVALAGNSKQPAAG